MVINVCLAAIILLGFNKVVDTLEEKETAG
jgi:hypothetical protein